MKRTICGYKKKTSICKYPILKLIGKCKLCNDMYCHIHRYPEMHKCENLHIKIENEKQTLITKLFNERCVSSKVDLI